MSGSSAGYLFQSERHGMTSYHIPLADGTYHLNLMFAENYYTKRGTRVFTVKAEGATILSNFDIFAKVGKNHADIESFVVKVTGNRLDLGFSATKDLAKISAIEILP